MTDRTPFVLVTAAYNEGKFIEETLKAVVAQERRPAKWVIVSDGSTDSTDSIVQRYAAESGFIELHRLTEEHPRNFGAQANAINAGIEIVKSTPHAFIGNLDADVTFEPAYFKLLLEHFDSDPQLGLAGGTIYDKCSDGTFKYRSGNRVFCVAHAVQLFRRECFDAIGGKYPVLPYGGPDTYAETAARMCGWKVGSIANLKVHHHRPTGSAGGRLRSCFRQGKMDHSLGFLPLFELARLLGRMGTSPYVIGSLARLAGFITSYARREELPVSEEFVSFLRREQRAKLKGAFGRGGLN